MSTPQTTVEVAIPKCNLPKDLLEEIKALGDPREQQLRPERTIPVLQKLRALDSTFLAISAALPQRMPKLVLIPNEYDLLTWF